MTHSAAQTKAASEITFLRIHLFYQRLFVRGTCDTDRTKSRGGDAWPTRCQVISTAQPRFR